MSVQRKVSMRGWAASLAAIFAGMAFALLQNKLIPVMDVVMEAFGVDMATAGLLSTIFTVMGIAMALPAAGMIQRFGLRVSGLVAFACAFAGSLLGLATENVAVLLASRVVEGTGVGIIAVLAPSVISMWFPPEKRGLPMAIWGSWMMVAEATVFFCGRAVADAWGWRGMWLLGIVVCLVATVLFLLFVKSPDASESYADVESSEVSVVRGLRSPRQWMLAFVALCYAFCCFSFTNWISSCWQGVVPWGAEGIGRWIAVLFVMDIACAWTVGALLGRVKSLRLLGMTSLVLFGLVGLASFTASGEPTVIAVAFGYALFDAITVAAIWSSAPAAASDPRYAGVALAVLNIGLNAGTLLSAPVSGMIQQSFGWTGVGIGFLVMACAGSALLCASKFVPAGIAERR